MTNQLTLENMFNERVIKRFYSKVSKDENGCLVWTGTLDRGGYGALNITIAPGTFVMVKAHRWAKQYELQTLITPDVFVCHRCDNRVCVNPEHLFLGSNMDNVLDMLKKGRNRSTLTHEQVWEIRSLIAAGKTDTEISYYYPVGRKAINDIRHKRTWWFI
ncbi:MAG: HNH endonuclease [Verrucomicrobia bacterium]|nr:HNH endonuclease [Verrucomicrobiota bacterium]